MLQVISGKHNLLKRLKNWVYFLKKKEYRCILSYIHTRSFGKKQALYIEFITSKLMYITNPDIKGIFIIHTKYGMMNVKLNMLNST